MRTRVLIPVAWAIVNLHVSAQQPATLRDLLAEADRNNAEIRAAEKEWNATTNVRAQVSSLPGAQFTLQEFSVGSPRPGAGLSNSNFAYVGVGASQEFPYPGKLRLKGAAADAAAGEQLAQVDVVRSKIAQQVKTSYVRLAYLQDTLSLWNGSRSTLNGIIDDQLARYGSGQGSQADILKAQLERTRLLREITMHHEEVAQVQADLKAALNRTQDSPDVIAEGLTPSQVARPLAELLRATQQKNPTLVADAGTIAKQQSAVDSTQLAGRPDFSVGYMYQRTGLEFPAYYMATLTVTLPRKTRVAAERAEASERLAAAMLMREANLQQQTADARKEYAALVSSEEELKEYNDGILPQAQAAYDSALAALRSNRQTLDSVLNSFNDILTIRREYAAALLNHETAIIRLEALTGESLR